MTTEIPQKNWERFCNRINDEYHGAVSIQLLQLDGVSRQITENLPFQSVTFKKEKNSCNDIVMIETGLPHERPAQHQIVEPIHIVLRKNDESIRYNHLEIPAENGTTLVVFHPGLNPALLDKLAA